MREPKPKWQEIYEEMFSSAHDVCNPAPVAIGNSRTRTEEKTMNEDLGGMSAGALILRFQDVLQRIGHLEYREQLAKFQGMVVPVPDAMRVEAAELGGEIFKRMVS